MDAFSRLSDIITAFGSLIPRRIIVRATHGGLNEPDSLFAASRGPSSFSTKPRSPWLSWSYDRPATEKRHRYSWCVPSTYANPG